MRTRYASKLAIELIDNLIAIATRAPFGEENATEAAIHAVGALVLKVGRNDEGPRRLTAFDIFGKDRFDFGDNLAGVGEARTLRPAELHGDIAAVFKGDKFIR